MQKVVKNYQESTYTLTESEVRTAIVDYMNAQHKVVTDKGEEDLHVFVGDDCKLEFKGDPSWFLKVTNRYEVE